MTALWPHVTFEIYLCKQAQCITCVLVGALCHTFLALIPSPFFSVVFEFPIPPPTMPFKENLEGNNSRRKCPQNASAETEEQQKKKRTTKYLWLTHILLKLNPWLSLGIRNQKGSTKWKFFHDFAKWIGCSENPFILFGPVLRLGMGMLPSEDDEDEDIVPMWVYPSCIMYMDW